MQQKPTKQATACPLFAEWKLTDAVREFGNTLDIPACVPVIQIPLPNHLTETITAPEKNIRYLPLTITGWQRIRRGRHYFFVMQAITGDLSDRDKSSIPVAETPVQIIVSPAAGYFTTLRRMALHALPLNRFESLLAAVLGKIIDGNSPQKNNRCRPLILTTDATRITLPEGEVCDLPLGRILTREEATSHAILRESHAAYRRARGYECTTPAHTTEQEIFLTADLHLGHHDAIRYYCRPFVPDDTETMDRVLITNWNNTVSPDDRVIYAGDFTYKADPATTKSYQSQLNGEVKWIKGNHDTCLEDTRMHQTVTAGGHTFLIIHNPKHAPAAYQGWVIHGHTHNARLGEYPFISFTQKTVNISTDVTGFRPVPLKEILTLIREGEQTGRTEPILIREMAAATDITTVAPSSLHD